VPYPCFFVNGYLIFPQDQTAILEELSPHMKERLKGVLDSREKIN
jgi:hypothetical protein